jgi:superoxide dismutase, Cu-Zn family
MINQFKCFLVLVGFFISRVALADITIPMYFTTEQGVGKKAGTVLIHQTQYGLLLIPNLHSITPGLHGFHIHEHPSCDQNGMAAGGHLDPAKMNKHLGPYDIKGHLGDLPALYIMPDGTATLPVLAPRLSLKEIKNHTFMLHSGGDNYADVPDQLGGGGARMVCGVIKK